HQKGACSQATDFSQWWLTPVWADDYKSCVLVGTDGEGEAAEWAPNAIGYSVEERKQGMEQVSEAYKELYGKD
ncbi:hypothetical protein HCY48_05050, partial [Limosilactobacillus fermentum]